MSDATSTGGAASAAPLFGKDNLPVDNDQALGGHAWLEFRKTATTKALRIEGPFRVITIHGGDPQECEDGWLALDSQGHPYPIDDRVFQETFKQVGVPPYDGWQGTLPADGTRRRVILEAAKGWILANPGKPVTSEEEAIEFADAIEEALLEAAG